MKSVAIVEGWAEGSWQSKEFKNNLKTQGFKFVSDLQDADIIIGHSLGCYLLPKYISGKTIFLIGLPYWPKRSIIASVSLKLKNELKFHLAGNNSKWWLNKLIHNNWYVLRHPSLSLRGLFRSPSSLPSGQQNDVVIVRPSSDTFCHPNIMNLLAQAKNYKFVSISGGHDDCWFNPQPYIDLLLKEL